MNEIEELVEAAFHRSLAAPTFPQWRSMSIMAGAAAVRAAADGHDFLAAQLEGVAEYARRQAVALMPAKETA